MSGLSTHQVRLFDLAAALTAALAMACTPPVVEVEDCSAKCQDQEAKCLVKCTNEACRAQCKTDLDNCLLACGPNPNSFVDSGPGAFPDGGIGAALDSGVTLPVDASLTTSPGVGSGAPNPFDSAGGPAAAALPGR
jgi:hypothetical protein